jgi:HAD superfamily hydrolase (TIGR01484 family)
MKKHLFFDLDNTVTRSRSKIDSELKRWFLASPHDIVIMTGGTHDMIVHQMDGVPCYKLGQSGNHATDIDGNLLWEEKLTDEQKRKVSEHIRRIPITWDVSDENDLLQDRGCQVSYSLLGHNEVLEKKEAFDPDVKKRRAILEQYPFDEQGLQVKIGGTTVLDYTADGKHKGFYAAKLIEHLGWNKDDAIFFGDRLIPGGNDESVIGVIDTVAVESPFDTLHYLKTM